MSQGPNTFQGRATAAYRVPRDQATTPEQIEASALQSVIDHHDRVVAAAKLAFRLAPDPLRTFAEEVAASGVVLIRAMQKLIESHIERMRTASPNLQVSAQGQAQIIPAGDLLSLLGIYPADAIRFRLWAIGTACVILLATFGAGVLIGRSSVHDSAPVTTVLPE